MILLLINLMFQWMNWMKQHKSMGPPQADTARQWSVFEIFLLAFAVSDRLLRFFGKFLPLNHSASFCLSLSVVCLSFARLLPLVSPSSTFLLPIFLFHRHFTALFATIFGPYSAPSKIKGRVAGVVGVGIPLLHSDQITKLKICILSCKKEIVTLCPSVCP